MCEDRSLRVTPSRGRGRAPRIDPVQLDTIMCETCFFRTAAILGVTEFRYLGGLIGEDRALDREISLRLLKAARAFGCLQDSYFLMSCLVPSYVDPLHTQPGMLKCCSKSDRIKSGDIKRHQRFYFRLAIIALTMDTQK